MKILHVGVGNLGPGGVSTYVELVTKGLEARGHQVELVELWPAQDLVSPAKTTFGSIQELAEHARLAAPDAIHLHSQLPSYEGFPSRAVITAHEHSAHCPAGSRYLQSIRKECPIRFGEVGCTIGHFLFRCGSRDPASMRRRFEVTRNAAKFRGLWIAPSTYSRRMLLRRGFGEDVVRLLPNPGPEPGPAPKRDIENPPHFLFLGRLVPNKGCDVAIRAAAASPDLRLRIVGDGPERERLESLASSLGARDRVRFEGWLPRPEVERMLSGCLALVVPSLWPEPFGLVALEAFANEVPVIASRTGGLTDIVTPGEDGILFDPGSALQLSEAMSEIAGSGTRALEMGRRGARTLRDRFSLSSHLDALESIYLDASNLDGSPDRKDPG